MKTIKQSDVEGSSESGTPGSELLSAKVKVPKAKDIIGTDEHAGQGGSFVFDPSTGRRTPSEETRADRAAAKLAEEKRAADKATEQEGD